MALRELLYFDRERIESYISQLAGGLTVQESTQQTGSEKLSGGVKASIKILELQSGAEQSATSASTTTRVPAHAILDYLEALLSEARMLADAGNHLVLPGQIATMRGDATFESWGLLAELADSVQGIATLGAKIYGATQGADDLKKLRERLSRLEKLLRKQAGDPALQGQKLDLGSDISNRTTALSIIDGHYIEDVKEVIKLFFQNQNQFRISKPGGRTFVGLLRKENLVGSTMEELLFNYGSKPQASFGALFYVTEFGREDSFDPSAFVSRIPDFKGKAFSFGLVQTLIREVGSFMLECAEELRRPVGENAAFIVPLAIYREIRSSEQMDVT